MGGRILVVDDEAYILRILSFKLRRAGFTTFEARSAEDAEAIVSSHEVDLILLDVSLATPTNGFEFAARLRSRPATADLPIIMLTAHGLDSDVRQSHEVRAAGYITKPFSTAEVVERVRAILEA